MRKLGFDNIKRSMLGSTESPSRLRMRIALILLVLVIAAASGVMTGRWVVRGQDSPEDLIRMDEYLGLGERTGLAGKLLLRAEPSEYTVNADVPIRIKLVLTNSGKRSLTLNSWFQPAPADLRSNQLPIKVKIFKEGNKLPYHGNALLLTPHTKKDFFTLGPGKSRDIYVDLRSGSNTWDMASPGLYTAEIWYETYLTGKYVGVDAWTGMTNHVVVQIQVGTSRGSK